MQPVIYVSKSHSSAWLNLHKIKLRLQLCEAFQQHSLIHGSETPSLFLHKLNYVSLKCLGGGVCNVQNSINDSQTLTNHSIVTRISVFEWIWVSKISGFYEISLYRYCKHCQMTQSGHWICTHLELEATVNTKLLQALMNWQRQLVVWQIKCTAIG